MIAVPTSPPPPCTRFTTPSGTPASIRISTRAAAVAGVSRRGRHLWRRTLLSLEFPTIIATNEQIDPTDRYLCFGVLLSSMRRVTSVVFFPSMTASIHANTSFISAGGVECPALCTRTITS